MRTDLIESCRKEIEAGRLDTKERLGAAVEKMIDLERYRWQVVHNGEHYIVISGAGHVIARCEYRFYAEEIAEVHNANLKAYAAVVEG